MFIEYKERACFIVNTSTHFVFIEYQNGVHSIVCI
jgi:hypothetical protein